MTGRIELEDCAHKSGLASEKRKVFLLRAAVPESQCKGSKFDVNKAVISAKRPSSLLCGWCATLRVFVDYHPSPGKLKGLTHSDLTHVTQGASGMKFEPCSHRS